MTVETLPIYPIGKFADGDALCVEVHDRGYVNWYKTYACFDYDENGDLPDERPTLRDNRDCSLEDGRMFEWDLAG